MPNDIDLSTEALLAHRAKAEAATSGPWVIEKYNGGPYPGPIQIRRQDAQNKGLVSISVEGARNAAHIAANSPDVVKAHVDEILRLRAEVARLEREVERLNKEADWLAQEVNSWEHDQFDGTGNHIREVAELREAARKAGEQPCQE